MMDIDSAFKSIRTLYQTVTGKNDADVSLTYKSKDYGVTKPYIVKIDAREASHETYEGALTQLLTTLRKELSDKVKSTEQEALRLKAALKQLEN